MILKVVVCVACVQAVAVGVVSGKSLVAQPSHPRPFTAHQAQLNARTGPNDGWHPESLHHQGGRLSEPFSGRRSGQNPASECSLCPGAHEISPCACRCLNDTAASIECGPELASCSQLTEVMSLNSYPVDTYLRLVVADTALACKLEKALWGRLVFQEIEIINNKFQAVDNRAFEPFSATLTTLNLGGNTLQNVYFSTLSDTPLLRSLTLSYNEVDFLPGYSAIILPLLETFDASNNKIKNIITETFAGMPRVQKIDLSHNAITKVYERAFAFSERYANSLVVNLSNNAISSIEPGVLDGVRVCSLDLRNNHLINLPEAVYRPIIDFTAASAVFLTNNNHFNCGSNFCWIATNQTVSKTFSSVLCSNLGNYTVEVINRICTSLPSVAATRLSSSPRSHHARPAAFRKRGVSTAVRNLRRPFLRHP